MAFGSGYGIAMTAAAAKAIEADVCSIVRREELAGHTQMLDERLEEKGRNLSKSAAQNFEAT